MSDKYSLYYFGIPGRAEIIRIIFHVAGVDYNNITLNKEKFAELKQSGFLPFGKVPVLVKGDFKLAESLAITEYVSKKFNLWPQSDEDSAMATAIFSSIGDLVTLFFGAKDEKLKSAIEKFGPWEKTISKMLGEKDYFFDNKLTSVDLEFFYFIYALVKKENVTEKNLLSLYERVEKDESVSSYFE
jgi:glutathione S-transferase